jgi:hypothetical protein
MDGNFVPWIATDGFLGDIVNDASKKRSLEEARQSDRIEVGSHPATLLKLFDQLGLPVRDLLLGASKTFNEARPALERAKRLDALEAVESPIRIKGLQDDLLCAFSEVGRIGRVEEVADRLERFLQSAGVEMNDSLFDEVRDVGVMVIERAVGDLRTLKDHRDSERVNGNFVKELHGGVEQLNGGRVWRAPRPPTSRPTNRPGFRRGGLHNGFHHIFRVVDIRPEPYLVRRVASRFYMWYLFKYDNEKCNNGRTFESGPSKRASALWACPRWWAVVAPRCWCRCGRSFAVGRWTLGVATDER